MELVPFYPLYAVLFADSGLDPADIAALLAFWTITGLILEVPSGALGDTFSRRRLLMIGTCLRAAGFAIWVLWPTFTGFAIGFLLWSMESALNSGTAQALLYDELAALDAAARYPRWSARTHTASIAAQLIATLTAAPLYAVGGYGLIAGISAGVGLIGVLLLVSLPERPRVEHTGNYQSSGPSAKGGADGRDHRSQARVAPSAGGGWTNRGGGFRTWLAMLRAGTSEAARSPNARRWVLVLAVVYGCTALDEAFPLLAREVDVATAVIPLLIAVTVVGQLTGSALGGRRLADRPLAAVLSVAAVLVAAGSLAGSAWGFLPIAAGYGVVQYSIVLADARLQDSVAGPARATVTSVANLGAGFSALAAYAAWGAVAQYHGNTAGVAVMALAVLPAVWLLLRPFSGAAQLHQEH